MAKVVQFSILRRALARARRLGTHSEADVDRRDFLKSALAFGIALSPTARLLAPKPVFPKRLQSDPILILGGGLAGLTAAYQLTKAGIPCEIYEAQSRLGGRVFTAYDFNEDHMFCEIGGEFIDSSHTEILTLAKELGLAIDDLRPNLNGRKAHEFFFRGQRYYDSELAEACKPLVDRLRADGAKIFADPENRSVTYDNFKPAAVAFDRMSLTEYLEGIPELEPWVREAIRIAYIGEYGLDADEQPALNLLTLLDPEQKDFQVFGESDECFRIRGGNGRLVSALQAALAPHCPMHLGHRLVHLRETASGLSFDFKFGETTVSAKAARALCTLPFTTLREVEGIRELSLSPVKQNSIQSLGYGTNSKHMLGFHSRPWRESNPATTGYCFTDLSSQMVWDTSQSQSGTRGIITCFMGGKSATLHDEKSRESLLADLEKVFPGTAAQFDGHEKYIQWVSHPWVKGSYACPRLGQYTTIIGSAKEPELGGKLLFAGEHASENSQGYMNGAVETANAAVREITRLAAPLGSYTYARSGSYLSG